MSWNICLPSPLGKHFFGAWVPGGWRYWHKTDMPAHPLNVRYRGDCVAKLTAPSVGLGVSEWGALIARPPSGGSVADIFDELSLRSAGGWRHRRWSSDILGELSQVLGGGDEQNLVAGAAQAPQPQPVELQDALHVGNSISTFLRSRRDCWKVSVSASARKRSRTSSSMSRVTLRTGPMVHWGFSVQAEQSLLRAR